MVNISEPLRIIGPTWCHPLDAQITLHCLSQTNEEEHAPAFDCKGEGWRRFLLWWFIGTKLMQQNYTGQGRKIIIVQLNFNFKSVREITTDDLQLLPFRSQSQTHSTTLGERIIYFSRYLRLRGEWPRKERLLDFFAINLSSLVCLVEK